MEAGNYSIGMMGPIILSDFRDYLYPNQWSESLPKGLGGTPVNLLSLELLRRGNRLILFSLDPSVQDEIVLEGPNLRICVGPFRPKRARDFFSVECKYLKDAIARENPDVLHAQWTYEYALAAQASGRPHIITAHDAPITILRHNFIPYRIARTFMAYRVLMRAMRVVSVSPYVAQHLKRFMFYRGSSEVIPNGMPAHLFEKTSNEKKGSTPLTIATVLSSWSALKNGAAAIKAFSEVKKEYPEIRLIMFGTGHGSGEEAENWAKSNGSGDGIEFSGHQPHDEILKRLSNEVDILIHPSLEEAQCMAINEAMALGIPVIGGKCSGGVPWSLDDGRAGMLVDVESTEAISDALRQLINFPQERRDLGARAKCFAEKRFHISIVADTYEAIYSELLSV